MPELNPKSRRSGQMIIFAALTLTVLFSLLGLSADLGYSYYVQLEAQAAADAAAKGAAIYAKNNGYICTTYVACNASYSCPSTLTSAGNALQAGCLYAMNNGFTPSTSQSVSMIAGNTAVSGASPQLWIRANTSQTVSHLFLLLAGFGSGPVAAKATAGVNAAPNAPCVYVLDNGNTSGALTVSGGALLTASGCGVWVNSSNSAAITLSGSGNITSPSITIGNGGNANIGGGVSPVPTITRVGTTVSDPLASVPSPTVSATCKYNNFNPNSNGTMLPTYYSDGVTAYPGSGVYCGGISIGGSITMTMTSGIYVVNGGGFNMGGSGKVNGSGVTIYLTGQHGQTNGPMALSGGSVTTLTAPTGGPYQGILFYQDRTATYVSQNTISGSGALTGSTGTFYFKTTQMNLSGGISASTLAFVVWDLNMSGSATLDDDTTGTLTGLAARSTALLQ